MKGLKDMKKGNGTPLWARRARLDPEMPTMPLLLPYPRPFRVIRGCSLQLQLPLTLSA